MEEERPIARSSGDVLIKTGSFKIDDTSFLDVRLCDLGVSLSVCDVDLNIRYTIILDRGKTVLREVQPLMPEENS